MRVLNNRQVVFSTIVREIRVRTFTAVHMNRGFTFHLVSMHYVIVYADILKIPV